MAGQSTFEGAESKSPMIQQANWYDITLATPSQNLALDELLLQQVDENPDRVILRTWLPDRPFVVVGRSNAVAMEVDVPQCRSEGAVVYRRTSGGGAVVLGPGCLAFALVIPLTDEWLAGGVTAATRSVMQTIATGLQPLASGVIVQGISDLAVGDRKFSGNSQRWLRRAFLHHGTILFDFDLACIGRLLKSPSRQPEYRSGRSHLDFVMNLRASRESLVEALVATWNAQRAEFPGDLFQKSADLAASRYEDDAWTFDR